jgi:hypothetical protein
MFAYVDASPIFSHKVIVIADDDIAHFGLLQSRVHELWSRAFGTTFGSSDALTYSVGRVYVTFPKPELGNILHSASQYLHARGILLRKQHIGLTALYGRFHDRSETAEDIRRLRQMHADMDRAVLRAYAACAGTPEDAAAWERLAHRAEPIFLDGTNEGDQTYLGRLFWAPAFRDEVLSHLLALNAERAGAERAAGLSPIDVDAEPDAAEEADA